VLQLLLQLDGEEPSITSHETIASPEGRFLRRRHSQLTVDDDGDNDNEDQESLGSLEHAIPEAYCRGTGKFGMELDSLLEIGPFVGRRLRYSKGSTVV
jgi:hypothetical protein